MPQLIGDEFLSQYYWRIYLEIVIINCSRVCLESNPSVGRIESNQIRLSWNRKLNSKIQ